MESSVIGKAFKTTHSANPLVSVITVTYNADEHIEKSICSVLNQSYDNIEYIIVDGGSTDQTVRIINSHGSRISRFISEPDRGIYDAMNKAINIAAGEWLFFLGADDILYDDKVIESMFQHDLSPYSLVAGDIIRQKAQKRCESSYSWKLLLKNTLHHQGTFFRRSLFGDFSYDISCKVSADYELNLKSFLEKQKIKKVPQVIAQCGGDGVSNKIMFDGYLEEIRIRNKYLPRPIALMLNLLTLLRFLGKKLIYAILHRQLHKPILMQRKKSIS